MAGRTIPGVTNADRERIGLPVPLFTYTVDQIAMMMRLTEDELYARYLWLNTREYGTRPLDRIAAINIAPDEGEPVWRVEETEFVRWCKRKKFRTFIRDWTIT